MKVAPILAQLRRREGVKQVLVHTGQHYDARMSDVFFRDLGMPDPDVHLGVGSGTHAQQTAKVMVEIEPVLVRERPDVVVVAGGVIPADDIPKLQAAGVERVFTPGASTGDIATWLRERLQKSA